MVRKALMGMLELFLICFPKVLEDFVLIRIKKTLTLNNTEH